MIQIAWLSVPLPKIYCIDVFSEILDEINAVELTSLIDHVVAFELLDSSSFFKPFKRFNSLPKDLVVYVFCVPLRYFMEFE